MCDAYCILFGARNLRESDIKGKKVIEIGAYDENGSLRPFIESLNPSEYIGVDIVEGPGVDITCRAEDLLERFPAMGFDIVVSTETLEHIEDWRKVVSNLKHLCKPNGIILITTRSIGFPYHGYPYDFWRYEPEDMEAIFSDFDIMVLEKDTVKNGVYIKAKRRGLFGEVGSGFIRSCAAQHRFRQTG